MTEPVKTGGTSPTSATLRQLAAGDAVPGNITVSVRVLWPAGSTDRTGAPALLSAAVASRMRQLTRVSSLNVLSDGRTTATVTGFALPGLRARDLTGAVRSFGGGTLVSGGGTVAVFSLGGTTEERVAQGSTRSPSAGGMVLDQYVADPSLLAEDLTRGFSETFGSLGEQWDRITGGTSTKILLGVGLAVAGYVYFRGGLK